MTTPETSTSRDKAPEVAMPEPIGEPDAAPGEIEALAKVVATWPVLPEPDVMCDCGGDYFTSDTLRTALAERDALKASLASTIAQMERDISAMTAAIEAVSTLRAERDAAFALSRCECSPDEACANLAKLTAERDAARREAAEWRQSAEHNLSRRISALGERNAARTERDALRQELEAMRAVQASAGPAETQPIDQRWYIGAPKANRYHDAGAFAQCHYCKRYSLNARTLSDRPPACDCGKKDGWSGSFQKPGADAQWAGASPLPAPPGSWLAPDELPPYIAEVHRQAWPHLRATLIEAGVALPAPAREGRQPFTAAQVRRLYNNSPEEVAGLTRSAFSRALRLTEAAHGIGSAKGDEHGG